MSNIFCSTVETCTDLVDEIIKEVKDQEVKVDCYADALALCMNSTQPWPCSVCPNFGNCSLSSH